jgi:tRNA(His) 5'-end guanylyltransferase
MLRKEGYNEKEATDYLEQKSVAAKNELLFTRGINFNDLPNWQKRGIGLYWEEYEKTGFNPVTQASAAAIRKHIVVNYDLPMKDDYDAFIQKLISYYAKASIPVTTSKREMALSKSQNTISKAINGRIT